MNCHRSKLLIFIFLDNWQIHLSDLTILEEIGSGSFGVVHRAKWRGTVDAAVKMMKAGKMSEGEFIKEAEVMTKLQHRNVVQLYGVCSERRPIYIVTEYFKHGSLLSFLHRQKELLVGSMEFLLDMCLQARDRCFSTSFEKNFHLYAGLSGHGLSKEKKIYSSRFGGKKLSRWIAKHRQSSRLWTCSIRHGWPVHHDCWCKVPDQVGRIFVLNFTTLTP